MWFDSHMHTEFSVDSEMKASDALARAGELGMGCVFTEHYDFMPEGEMPFSFPPEDYWNAYASLRGDRLRLGVELGMTPESREANRAFLERAPFDQVIGSIHFVEGKDIYYPEIYEGREKEDVYHSYFKMMAEEAAEQDIDVLGHIDYIARNAPYENPELDYGTFQEDIDRVLEAVVERGIVLELNTRRLGTRRALKELAPVYRRYKEMGGNYATIGSDAHKPETIGANFAEALDFLGALGIQPVTFCKRNMEILRP